MKLDKDTLIYILDEVLYDVDPDKEISIIDGIHGMAYDNTVEAFWCGEFEAIKNIREEIEYLLAENDNLV